MRDLSARNSISSRNGNSLSGSYGLTRSADSGQGSGTSSSSLTSSFDSRALASFSISACAPLRLLDLVGAGQQRFEVAIGVDQFGRGLDPDARHAGHVVGAVAAQRLHLDDLVRADPEFLAHLGFADRPVGHRVAHHDPAVARPAASCPCRRTGSSPWRRPRPHGAHRSRSDRRPRNSSISIRQTPNASAACRTCSNCGARSSGVSRRFALYWS